MEAKRKGREGAVDQAYRWGTELGEIRELIGKRFSRAEPRRRAMTYV